MSSSTRHIAAITGTRAEFGLLRSTMEAIRAHAELELSVVVTGTHLLPGATSLMEIDQEFDIAAKVSMQQENDHGRFADSRALGRGIEGMGDVFERLAPDIVVVLGDRIEAFAAASAASVGGIRVAHIHGGDRAEGVADEAMRHAITKLAHIHLPATVTSAARIIAMGEREEAVHVVGSPAVDGLEDIATMNDAAFAQFGSPDFVVLMHPIGRDDSEEEHDMTSILQACQRVGKSLVLEPNYDPGRVGIMNAIAASGLPSVPNLPRPEFIGLLKRVGLIVGNSSAGLIECAAIGVQCVNIGARQRGRERVENVVNFEMGEDSQLMKVIHESMEKRPWVGQHPYGKDGTGERIARLLGSLDLETHPLRKRIVY